MKYYLTVNCTIANDGRQREWRMQAAALGYALANMSYIRQMSGIDSCCRSLVTKDKDGGILGSG